MLLFYVLKSHFVFVATFILHVHSCLFICGKNNVSSFVMIHNPSCASVGFYEFTHNSRITIKQYTCCIRLFKEYVQTFFIYLCQHKDKTKEFHFCRFYYYYYCNITCHSVQLTLSFFEGSEIQVAPDSHSKSKLHLTSSHLSDLPFLNSHSLSAVNTGIHLTTRHKVTWSYTDISCRCKHTFNVWAVLPLW